MKTDTIVKPSYVTKYLYGYTLIALVVAVTTLFKMHVDMNEFIRKELRDMVIKSTVVIEQNNALLKEQSKLK